MELVKWLIALIIGAAIGYVAHDYIHLPTFTHDTGTKTETSQKPDTGTVCAQVITMARNPKTGDLKQFNTPCDVPKGWEVIQNDVPGIDLQPQ